MKTQDETARIAARVSIRKDIGRRALLNEQIAALDGELARLDAEVAAASDKHSEICLPLQAELAKLEEQAIARVVRRECADTAADQRRREIRSEIELQNSELQRTSKAVEGLKTPLVRKRDALVMEAAQLRTEMDLGRKAVANPEIWLKNFAANKRIQLLSSAIAAAREIQTRVAPDSHVGTYDNGDHEEWGAYAQLLGADLMAAQADASELQRQLIEE